MKILFITHYFEPDSGAAANRLTRLARKLHQRGHDITVLTTLPHYPTGIVPQSYQRKFVVVEELEGIRVIQTWLYTSPKSGIKHRLLGQLTFMLTCTLRGLFIKRPDVILIENQPIFTALAGWIISRFKRAPYLANISDFWPEYLVVAGVATEQSLIYRVFKTITNHTQRQADAIVTLYPPLLENVQSRIGKVKNGSVIYNAVDFDKFLLDVDDHDFRAKHHLGDATLITFLGILGAHIDLETMLAVAEYYNDYEKLKFVFVGTGQQKEALRQALTRPELSHCHWIDWIEYEDVPAFWSASYITYWSLHNNPLDQMRFQAKLFEAMGTGTPVVVGVKGLMHDIITKANAGITVMPNDIDAMIEAINKLLTDEDYYQSVSKHARQYAFDNFNPDHNADRYETILKQITHKD